MEQAVRRENTLKTVGLRETHPIQLCQQGHVCTPSAQYVFVACDTKCVVEVQSFSKRSSEVRVSAASGFSAASSSRCACYFSALANWLVCTSCLASNAGAAEVAIHMLFVFVVTACLKSLALCRLCLSTRFCSPLLPSATTMNPHQNLPVVQLDLCSACSGASCGTRHIVSHFSHRVALKQCTWSVWQHCTVYCTSGHKQCALDVSHFSVKSGPAFNLVCVFPSDWRKSCNLLP